MKMPGGAVEELYDVGSVRVRGAADGYYWRPKGARREHGPFLALVDALDDMASSSGRELAGEPEDWLDKIGYEAGFLAPPIDTA